MYSLDDLFDDQKQVIAYILKKIMDWLSHLEYDNKEDLSDFKPLHLTIIGAAGTGKSVVINTLVTVICKIFGVNDVVHVAAPTGCAAFNVGETLHRLCRLVIDDEFNRTTSLSEMQRKELMCKFKCTVALIIDERSMVSLQALGGACSNVTTCAHGGVHREEDWGGLPVVLLVGDDYQLPPFGKGVFDAFNMGHTVMLTKEQALGAEQFFLCANEVMELDVQKRANAGQEEFRAIL